MQNYCLSTMSDSTVALATLSAVTLSQQMLSLASSTLKMAASVLRFQQQSQQQDTNQVLQQQPTTPTDWSQLPQYSLEVVSHHQSCDDCWIVIYDKIYNVTDFISQHPGGADIIMENAGCDATLAFRSVGHSPESVADMERFLVGILPPSERIYLRNL